MSKNQGVKTPRDVNAGVRAAQAITMRARKLPLQQIANECGYASPGAAYNAIQRELQRTVVENVDELRREESLILDQLHARCMEAAMDKSNRGFLFAVDRVIAVRERFAKLYGLDAAKDGNIAAAQVVIREIPAGYLGEVKSE